MLSFASATVRKMATASSSLPFRYVEIGANLLDSQFRGKYHGKKAHGTDFDLLLYRAEQIGMTHLMVTCSNLKDSRRAIEMCETFNRTTVGRMRMACTVGVHPTNTKQLEFADDDKPADASASDWSGDEKAAHAHAHSHPSSHAFNPRTSAPRSKAEYIAALESCIEEGIKSGVVVAIGECGLDYDRLFFSPKEVQLRHFEFHLDLSERYQLPLFLHDRNTGGDFLDIIKRHRSRIPGGVVHSFTGTAEEAKAYLDLGLFIGINGCSLKTEDNCRVASTIPMERLMLETDAPWCEIKRTHHSYQFVKTHFNSLKKEKYDPSVLKEYSEMKRSKGELPAAAAPAPEGASGAAESAAPAAGPAAAAGGKKGGGGGAGNKKGGASSAAATAGGKPAFDESVFTVVQGRSEPCQIVQVAEVVAALKGVSLEELATACYDNTMRVFFPKEAGAGKA